MRQRGSCRAYGILTASCTHPQYPSHSQSEKRRRNIVSESTLIAYDRKITRQELALVPTPERTATHQTIPHHEVVNALIETLGFRHIAVSRDEYAVDRSGAKMFGLMVLDQGMDGASFALGIRNSHDKSFRLSITVGYEVFVCQNMAFKGDFEPVLAKHSKNFSLQNALSIGVDQMQRNFKPMVESVERWRESQLSDAAAKLLIYRRVRGRRISRSRGTLPRGARILLQSHRRGIPTAHDVEPVERVYQRVQGARSDSAVQGHGQTCILFAGEPAAVSAELEAALNQLANMQHPARSRPAPGVPLFPRSRGDRKDCPRLVHDERAPRSHE